MRSAVAACDSAPLAAGAPAAVRPVRLDEPCARHLVAPWPVVALGVAQLHPGLVGEVLHRLVEGEAVVLHQEADDVAALPAPEAVTRQDVVLEDERVTFGDLAAVDLLDAVGLLDRSDHPTLFPCLGWSGEQRGPCLRVGSARGRHIDNGRVRQRRQARQLCRRVDLGQLVALLQASRDHFPTGRPVLARPDEPAMAVGRVDLLDLPVPGQRELPQLLPAVGLERRPVPPRVHPQDAVHAAGKLRDGPDAIPRHHPGLAGQAVEALAGADVERR